MGLRTLLRTTATLATATVVAALLTAPSATAHVCLDCEDPELPGPGGPSCPTIAATTMPSTPSPSSPKVNAPVTANTGVWNSNTDKLLVIWYAGNTSTALAVSYPTRAQRTVTFTPDANDQGKPIRLYVRGIGTDSACVKGEYSEATSNVAWGDAPLATSAPSILGDLTVGSTVQAHPGAWNMTTDSLDFAWRWEDGTLRGTEGSYALTAADLGKKLRLDVTANRTGHHPGSSSVTTGVAVGEGPALVSATAPEVTGSAVYGETLTATDGTWTPAAADLEREWLRNGQPIAGADGASYELGPEDVGTSISLRVTAHADGYASGTTTVEVGTVSRAAAPTWTGKKLRLKGKDKVKKKVKVALGATKIRSLAAAPDAVLTYQWLRNGKALKTSTKRTHKIATADRKKKLKARITLTRPGHHPLVITTKAVKIKNTGKKIK